MTTERSCREEFLQSELKKAFTDEQGDAAEVNKADQHGEAAADERMPEHLNTQAIADVSVPGFNTGVLCS